MTVGGLKTMGTISKGPLLVVERAKNLGIDTQDATYFYFGFTKVGTTEWRIKRMKKSDYSIDWASGTTTPQDNWNDRKILTYNISL